MSDNNEQSEDLIAFLSEESAELSNSNSNQPSEETENTAEHNAEEDKYVKPTAKAKKAEPKTEPKKKNIKKIILIVVGGLVLLLVVSAGLISLKSEKSPSEKSPAHPVEDMGLGQPATADSEFGMPPPMSSVPAINDASSVAASSVPDVPDVHPVSSVPTSQNNNNDKNKKEVKDVSVLELESQNAQLLNEVNRLTDELRAKTKPQKAVKKHVKKHKVKLTKPVEAKPVESVVERTKPVEAKPVESVVERTKPVEAKPVESVVERIPVSSAPAEPINEVQIPKAQCEFRGSLVNRAWIVCDGKLMSVKAGDILPYPYIEAVRVTDGQSNGGSVLTKHGVIN